MGILAKLFGKKPVTTKYPVAREITFSIFAHEVNKYRRLYALVFDSENKSLEQNGVMWVDVHGKDYRLYISKCELIE